MSNLQICTLRAFTIALLTFFTGSECYSQFVKNYQYSLTGNDIGFFDSGSSIQASTIYFDESISYSLNDLTSDLGMSSGSNPFNWEMDIEVIDLNAIGLNCCDLGTVGYDFDMDFTLGASMWMQHQVENGQFSIDYPMGVTLSIPEYNRGDVITVSLDSAYAGTPTLGITNPTLEKDLKTSFTIAASSDIDVFLGPFGSKAHTFFDFDETYEATLLHVGADGFSGDLGLVQNSNMSLIPGCTSSWGSDDGYEYDLDSDNNAYDGTYTSNICMSLAPCLAELEAGELSYDPMEYWYRHCQLRVPFVDDIFEDMLGSEVVPFFASEPWFTTAPQLSLDWPMGLSLTLDYPDDEIVENIPNWATGVLSAQTAEPVPYFDLGHNYLDMLEDLLKFGCPDYPGQEAEADGPGPQPNNPYACAALLAVDNRQTADNEFLEDAGFSDGERISVWTYMTSSVPSISLPWGDFSLSDMAPFDFWVEYNLLDLESHFTITNEFGVEYDPEVRVRLQFSEEVEYRVNPTDEWSTASVIDMPIDGDFELKTNCSQYELNVVPEPYLVTSAPDMKNTGTDSYDTYLDVDALNFNVGVDGANIIPAFGVEFLCVGSVSEFLSSLGSCAVAALEWVTGAWCCFKDFFGDWPWNYDWECADCWQETGECETCNYGFDGLTLPSYDMAADVCSTSDAFQENGMCGYFWRIPFSSTEDQYAESNWLVDAVTFNEPSSDNLFVGESLTATAIPFELTDVSPAKTAVDYGFKNAIVQVERTGGVSPITLHAKQFYQPTAAVFENPHIALNVNGNSTISFTSLPEHGDVNFQLDGQDRFNTKPALLERYALQDDNGCFADFVFNDVVFQSFGEEASDVSNEMLDLAIANVLPTGEFCGDADSDGCNDCSSGSFDVSNDGDDYDGDGICNMGDTDDDNDGVSDNADSDPLNEYVCSDLDFDGCDDCSSGSFDMANDGTDTNGSGICDLGDNDIDGDGASNDIDTDDSDIYVCGDVDNDGCEDCLSGSYAPLNDGDDFDGDGLCDFGDPDIDNDSVVNAQDPDDYSLSVCGDSDADGCDDCNSGVFDPENDGTDTDADGICDTEDPDIDGDGSLNAADSDDYNDRVCSDTDNDGCDDCQSGAYNVALDGADYDGDGLCNSGDDDIDGDGMLNTEDPFDYDAYSCGDTDGDGYDDCLSGQFDPNNDCYDYDANTNLYSIISNADIDGDGLCNSGDPDADGDGVYALVLAGGSSATNILTSYIANDPDDTDPYICGDIDDDGCDDCSTLGYYIDPTTGVSALGSMYFTFLFANHLTALPLTPDTVYVVQNDGDDSDGDGFCDSGDAFPNDATKIIDADDDGVSFYRDCDDDNDTVGEPTLYYIDADSDGFGDPNVSLYFCDSAAGYVTNANDCDDTDSNVNPNGIEICDGLDNNCNNLVDENPTNGATYYQDLDGDGFGNPDISVVACTQPVGYVLDNTDPNDTDPNVTP